MCDRLLHNANLVSFEKFKYAFEAGFPFTNNLLIHVSNIEAAEQIWHYTNNSGKVNFRYTIGNTLYLEFLSDYIKWIKIHEIKDIKLYSIWIAVAILLGIPGLEILLTNGYLIPQSFASIEMEIDSNVKNWLFEHEFII